MADVGIDATDFGYVSTLRDQPKDIVAQTAIREGGYCYGRGFATSAMTPGNVVVVDTAAANSFKTTTSAAATTAVGYVVAGLGTVMGGQQWDYSSTIASGQQILILLKGVVIGVASTSIAIGARVGTSTTAGAVVTTTTQDTAVGRAISTATTAGDAIYILV
jgi:hypothetical protein